VKRGSRLRLRLTASVFVPSHWATCAGWSSSATASGCLAQGAAGNHRGASAVQPFASMQMRYSLASRLPSVPAPTLIGVPLAPTDIRGSWTQA
jgi:hypothetical protein